MPTAHRFLGLRVVIYPNDHRPAHVHVIGKGCEAVFRLNPPVGPCDLRQNFGFSPRDLTMIAAELDRDLVQLHAQWSAIHGD